MSIADGRKIAIRFTQPLIGNILGLDPPVGYKKSLLDLSGAVVTTLNQYSTSYTGSKATDNNTFTYWRGTTVVNWLKLQLSEAKCVTQIRLYLSSYYIKTFTFSGSNDGETWVQLGGEYTAASSTTAQWYTFAIENSASYLYYKIDTLTAYSSSRIYLYELDLYEDTPVGNEAKFTVSFDEYNYVPGGTASKKTQDVASLEVADPQTLILNFDPGCTNSIQRAAGDITVAYDGSGTLMGQGGPVLAFEKTFTPVDLDPKNNPHDEEHLSVSSIESEPKLLRVYYQNTSLNEHVSIDSVVSTCALIAISDI